MQLLLIIGAASSLLALSGDLAYVDNGAVSIVNLESNEVRRVGPGPSDGPPRWSPGGAWLAFETAPPEGGRALYVVGRDGSNGRIVGMAGAWNTAPAWSPDGTRLVYQSARAPGEPAVLRVAHLNSDKDEAWGGGRPGLVSPQWLPFTLLLRSLDPDQKLEIPGVDMPRLLEEAQMQEADLRAQGSILPDALLATAFVPKTRNGEPVLGTSIVLVTRSEVLPVMALAAPDGAMDDSLTWSVTANWDGPRIEARPEPADGFGAYVFTKSGASDRLAFESNLGGDREIYVLGKRGIANVTNHRSADWNPVWSPDGKILAFESFRGGRRGLYRLYSDTAHVSSVAVNPEGDCWSPAWSPDGKHLAYLSNETGDAKLFIVSINDGEVVPLELGQGPKEAPAWRPDHR